MAANAARRAMSISEEQPAIFTMYQYIFIDIYIYNVVKKVKTVS